MGEYAEMMLDGTCCSQCGECLADDEDFEPQGFPDLCASCAEAAEESKAPCTECKSLTPEDELTRAMYYIKGKALFGDFCAKCVKKFDKKIKDKADSF